MPRTYSVPFALLALACAPLAVSAMSLDEARAAEIKFDRIATSQLKPGEVVVVTDEELNSYLHYIYAEEMPDGVRGLRVGFRKDRAHVRAIVDFSKVSANGDGPGGFLMMFLRGERPVEALVRYVSSRGVARIDVDSFKVDGREMKGVLLNWMVNRFVAPNLEGFQLGEPVDLGNDLEQIRLELGEAVVTAKEPPSAAQ